MTTRFKLSERKTPEPKLLTIPVTNGNAMNCVVLSPVTSITMDHPVLFCKGFVWDADKEAANVKSRFSGELSVMEDILVNEYGLAIASVSPASYPGYKGALTLETYLDDVAIVADELGAKAAMGHSFGGYVVGQLALRKPFSAIASLCAPFSLKEAIERLCIWYEMKPKIYAELLLGVINAQINLAYHGRARGAAKCVSELLKKGLTRRLGHINAEAYVTEMVGSVINALPLDALVKNGSGAGFGNTRVLVVYGKDDPLVIGEGAGLSLARRGQDSALFEHRWNAIAPNLQVIGLPMGHNLKARGNTRHQDYTPQIAAAIGNHFTVRIS